MYAYYTSELRDRLAYIAETDVETLDYMGKLYYNSVVTSIAGLEKQVEEHPLHVGSI